MYQKKKKKISNNNNKHIITHKSILCLRVHYIRHDVIPRRENVVSEYYVGSPIQM